MGREVWVEIRDKDNKPVWSSVDEDNSQGYFCGRYQETNLLVYRAKEVDDECLVDITDKEQFDSIEHELEECSDKAGHQYDQLAALHEDLLAARRHAATLKDFNDFTEYADDVRNTIQDTYWSFADDMIRVMNRGLHKLRELCGLKAWDDDADCRSFGYRLIWVISE